MPTRIPPHIRNLQSYLSQPSERNEDQALAYFRSLFPDFDRQSDAKNADGYVPGHFVLELKGKTNDWYKALFQGYAYSIKGLTFSLIVVACKDFLAVWSTDKLPDDVKEYVATLSDKSPSKIGELTAQKFRNLKDSILRVAEWYRPEIFTSLFSKDEQFATAIHEFEKVLRDRKRKRIPITLRNFLSKLGEMKQYFTESQPIKTVRAFYAMLYAPWNELSHPTQNSSPAGRQQPISELPNKL